MTGRTEEAVALFDLDGTITDPHLGITRCITHALEQLDADVPSGATLRSWIGPPLQQSFADHLGSVVRANEALQLYRARFATTGLYENELIGGMYEALSSLRSRTDRMMVVTSKPTVFAQKIVEHFGVSEHFDAVHGSELDGTHGDKTELLAHVLDTQNIQPETATMIGDRRYDIAAARQHRLRSIGVLWGFGDRQELIAAGASCLCVAVSELPGCYLNGN